MLSDKACDSNTEYLFSFKKYLYVCILSLVRYPLVILIVVLLYLFDFWDNYWLTTVFNIYFIIFSLLVFFYNFKQNVLLLKDIKKCDNAAEGSVDSIIPPFLSKIGYLDHRDITGCATVFIADKAYYLPEFAEDCICVGCRVSICYRPNSKVITKLNVIRDEDIDRESLSSL